MGVHGLWRLIEPSGKPVPVETLENKVLAVDISIWLHQAVKGFQDSKGAPLPNAHLLGIYHRVCKLLYFKIKPVFVFDGGVPTLKKQTIAKRNQIKQKNVTESDRLQKQLLKTLLKHSAVNKVLSEKAKAVITVSPTEEKQDIFKLPPSEFDSTISSSSDEEEEESSASDSPTKQWNMHNIDTKSVQFKTLPADVRHEILTDLKETRKQSSWGKLHELPTQSNDFSSFQMNRLLKRQSVQTALEEAEKEMGGHSMSLAELENILEDQGVISKAANQRIASDENKRYLFIKDVKKAIEEARQQDLEDQKSKDNQEVSNEDDLSTRDGTKNVDIQEKLKNKADLEYDEDLAKAISLSLECEPSTSSEEKPAEPMKAETKDNKDDVDTKNVTDTLALQKKTKAKADLEYDEDLAQAIALSLECKPSTSGSFESKNPVTESQMELSILMEDNESDSSDGFEDVKSSCKLTSAQNYMKEYSGLSLNEIEKIIKGNTEKIKSKPVAHSKSLTKKTNLEEIKKNESEENNKNPEYKGVLPNKTYISELQEKEKSEEVILTDDSEDDLIEVSETSLPVTSSVSDNCMEIVIEPGNFKETDDLFSDIFDSNTSEKSPETKITNKVDETIKKHSPAPGMNLAKTILNKADPKSYSEDAGKIEISQEVIKETSLTKDLDNNGTNEESDVIMNNSLKDSFFSNSKENENLKKIDTQEVARKPSVTVEQLEELNKDLRREESDLRSEKNTRERLAGNITDQMYQEAQELLELFGVPYITAPMEAEAQCAFLDLISLTEGTITDDSDIWLFGGKTVYKNFFNQSKHVMEFKAENIQHHFKLAREQMILLALLVGSDYTSGLPGVGPVTALEILASFPPGDTTFILSQSQLLTGLNEFKTWFKNRTVSRTKNSLRHKLKNLVLTENFPNIQVVQAYLEPVVDTNAEKFSWEKPDFLSLIDFARIKFGWTKLKSEEILNPVIKKINESRQQLSIKNYFKTDFKITSDVAEGQMSKRVKTAIKKMGQEAISDEDEPKEKKKKINKKNSKSTTPKEDGESKGKKKRLNKKDMETETHKDKLGSKFKSKKKTAQKKSEEELSIESDPIDEDLKALYLTQIESEKRVKEITAEAKKQLEVQINKEKTVIRTLHRKEIIPQKERDKNNLLNTKLKAVEVFRKSKKGPGYLKKGMKTHQAAKPEAALSESDSD